MKMHHLKIYKAKRANVWAAKLDSLKTELTEVLLKVGMHLKIWLHDEITYNQNWNITSNFDWRIKLVEHDELNSNFLWRIDYIKKINLTQDISSLEVLVFPPIGYLRIQVPALVISHYIFSSMVGFFTLQKQAEKAKYDDQSSALCFNSCPRHLWTKSATILSITNPFQRVGFIEHKNKWIISRR